MKFGLDVAIYMCRARTTNGIRLKLKPTKMLRTFSTESWNATCSYRELDETATITAWKIVFCFAACQANYCRMRFRIKCLWKNRASYPTTTKPDRLIRYVAPRWPSSTFVSAGLRHKKKKKNNNNNNEYLFPCNLVRAERS